MEAPSENVLKRTEEEAIHWLTKSAENGHLDGMYHLATYCLNGIYLEKDEKEAVNLLNQLEDYSPAKYLLGVCYFNGWGVTKDRKAAEDIFYDLAKEKFEPQPVEGGSFGLMECWREIVKKVNNEV